MSPPSAPVPGPGPLVGWVAPDEPSGLGVGEIIRAGWRLTTANFARLAAITAVPVFLVQVLLLPFWWGFGRVYERMFTFYASADWQRYADDPEGLRRDLQAVMQQPNEIAAFAVVAGGVAFVIGILGAAALAAATLDAADGRRPTMASAYGAVARRVRPIVVPALVLGLGYIVVLAPISMNSGSFASADLGPGRSGLTALLSLAVLILEIAAFYLAIRWAPYFQVVIAEDAGVRDALRRSSAVTRGVRLRLALALIAVSIVGGPAVRADRPAGRHRRRGPRQVVPGGHHRLDRDRRAVGPRVLPGPQRLAHLRLPTAPRRRGRGASRAGGGRLRLRPPPTFETAASTASPSSAAICTSSGSVTTNGGPSRIVSPFVPSALPVPEYTSRPRPRASRTTASVTRAARGNGARLGRSATSSMPTRRPRPRISPTAACPPSRASTRARRRSPFEALAATRSSDSRMRSTSAATAAATGWCE